VKTIAFVRRPLWALTIALGLIASVWIAHDSNTVWDYPLDAGPPIDALVHLRIHEFLQARPAMGPLSLVFRAPFAALGQAVGHGGSHHFYLDDYRYGVFACLLAVLAIGIAIGRSLERQGRPPLVCAAVALAGIFNPVTFRAIHFGHPEEVLGSALLVGSMYAAMRRKPWLSLTLVALAVLNKQWALVGLPAVVLTLSVTVGWKQLRAAGLVILGVGVLVIVPALIVDAHSLYVATKNLGDLRGTYTFPADIWYGIAPDLTPARAANSLHGLRDIPDWLGLIARPLIIAVGIVVPIVFLRRLRGDVQKRAFPLLALVMLLRCLLDPADNSWYHLPFLLSLVVADAIGGRFYATAVAYVLLYAPTALKLSPDALAFFYVCWAPAFAVYLAGRAYGLDWVDWLRSRGVRGQRAARPVRSS
jgi:hypothetical protein